MTWLSFLLLLLCPLSMMFMMKGHQHGGHSGAEPNVHANHTAVKAEDHCSEPGRIDSYKIKQLEGEVDLLKNQNEILQKRIEELSKNNISQKQIQ